MTPSSNKTYIVMLDIVTDIENVVMIIDVDSINSSILY